MRIMALGEVGSILIGLTISFMLIAKIGFQSLFLNVSLFSCISLFTAYIVLSVFRRI
jgi:uncharacterized membrane protein YadS